MDRYEKRDQPLEVGEKRSCSFLLYANPLLSSLSMQMKKKNQASMWKKERLRNQVSSWIFYGV